MQITTSVLNELQIATDLFQVLGSGMTPLCWTLEPVFNICSPGNMFCVPASQLQKIRNLFCYINYTQPTQPVKTIQFWPAAWIKVREPVLN